MVAYKIWIFSKSQYVSWNWIMVKKILGFLHQRLLFSYNFTCLNFLDLSDIDLLFHVKRWLLLLLVCTNFKFDCFLHEAKQKRMWYLKRISSHSKSRITRFFWGCVGWAVLTTGTAYAACISLNYSEIFFSFLNPVWSLLESPQAP